ncbi:hypothetical protein QEH56_02060 [Pelagicoccus enzymogenes]|nr:hypothetical protein [Pelagicoccus enzymogenes]MDQ8196910.1 hypothetical protein [Pelagicoccus enzymogenes]
MDTNKEDQGAEIVPVFGSWRRTYWFVALFFVVEVVAFYVFTQHYS